MKGVVCCLLLGWAGAAVADSVAREAGRTVGEFGAGMGEVVGQGMARSLSSMQPEWITIPPRSKEECLAEAGGVLNSIYMRCRNGRQEYVRYGPDGRKRVLDERPIPAR